MGPLSQPPPTTLGTPQQKDTVTREALRGPNANSFEALIQLQVKATRQHMLI